MRRRPSVLLTGTAAVLIGVSVVIHGFGTVGVLVWLTNALQHWQNRGGRLPSGLPDLSRPSSW